MSKHLEAKILAWHAQHQALQAESYRITLVDRDPKRIEQRRAEGKGERGASYNPGKGKGCDGAEKFFSAAEVEAMLPKLARENARGLDVYLTPISASHHYMVVDDMTPKSLDRLKQDGYTPCLVQQSSRNNRQAIVKVPKHDGPNEQSLANRVVQDLNRNHGGDPNFSGVVHPFRMAGFSNKKLGKENAFTRLIEIGGQLCMKVAERIEQLRQDNAAEIKQIRHRAAIDATKPLPAWAISPSGGQDADKVFRSEYRKRMGLEKTQGWPHDPSRCDFHAAISMRIEGWEPPQIERAMLLNSPLIDARKHDPQDYVRRTMAAAEQSQDVQDYLAERECQAQQQKHRRSSRLVLAR